MTVAAEPLVCPTRSLSADGTVKFSFAVGQGVTYESCLLNLGYRRIPRVVCVSTQIGCPFDCAFCAVGRIPLQRNLSASEIFNQVLHALTDPLWRGMTDPFEVAAMGTGEPMCALEEVIGAVRQAKHAFPNLRSLNVATVGIPEKIERYADECVEGIEFHLQLSLHGTTDQQRTHIMPRAARVPIADILAACSRFARKHGRQVLVNYLLLDGFNDSEEDAMRLIKLLAPELYSVKLSVLNRTPTFRFDTAGTRAFQSFCSVIARKGLQVRIFTSAGVDIGAGCGQFSNSLARPAF